MKTKISSILTIATVCLVILVLVSSGLTLVKNFGLMRMAFDLVGFPNGNTMPDQGNFPLLDFILDVNFPGGGIPQQMRDNFDPNNSDAQRTTTTCTFH